MAGPEWPVNIWQSDRHGSGGKSILPVTAISNLIGDMCWYSSTHRAARDLGSRPTRSERSLRALRCDGTSVVIKHLKARVPHERVVAV